MILQLLGTLLLTAFNGAMSVESQRSSAPIKENTYKVNDNNYLNNGYCLKHVEDTDSYFEAQLLDHNVTYHYSYNDSMDIHVYVPLYDSDMLYSLSECSFFDLNYNYSDNEIYFRFSTIEYVDNFEVLFYRGNDFTDLNSNVPNLRYLAIYFDSPFYLNEDVKLLFDTIFTSQLNSFYRSYTGWYTFNNGAFITSFNVASSMLWSNNIFDFLQCTYDSDNLTTNMIIYNTRYTVEDLPYSLYVIMDGGLQKSPYIYFNFLFCNKDVYSQLELHGVFNYVATPSVSYGLDDLFLNIADTPVIFITRLFSFELFGVEFYIAFMGIITAIAMIYIVRKIL